MMESCELLDLHKLLGKKWTYALLHNITRESQSFNELHSLSGREINATLLSDRLRELERFNVIKKTVADRRVFYTLTPTGEKLKQALHQVKCLACELNCTIPEKCQERMCEDCTGFRKEKFS